MRYGEDGMYGERAKERELPIISPLDIDTSDPTFIASLTLLSIIFTCGRPLATSSWLWINTTTRHAQSKSPPKAEFVVIGSLFLLGAMVLSDTCFCLWKCK